jgi:hypothetical protein
MSMITPDNLEGHRALVTGATSGIGRAVAGSGGRASFVAADLGDPADVQRLADDVGEVDILINQAGISRFPPTAEFGPPRWRRCSPATFARCSSSSRHLLPDAMTETIGQLTAPNLRVEAADGVRYVHRRFGNAETSALPLLMLIHYRANLDNWDPALVDALAQEREVVLIDNIGVAGSSGMTPSTVGEMALGVIALHHPRHRRR